MHTYENPKSSWRYDLHSIRFDGIQEQKKLMHSTVFDSISYENNAFFPSDFGSCVFAFGSLKRIKNPGIHTIIYLAQYECKSLVKSISY